ncbi:hypothetical protein RR48_12236 [Papilio machaon]|uniref:CHK kinase-like domain-containing protein n=1 Tax=Papilio machaon TaxID=76193 RepID=A0A194QSI3_PAPMA|nr:hypothetical protein RR48_12236 [Papilio machaon]
MRTRKISRPHTDLIDIINKVAEISNLSNIKYVIEMGHDNVDGFVGGAHKVKIRGTRDKLKITKSVIIKWHPNPVDRACFREAYLREISYYKYIVPNLLDIQRKYNIIEGLRMKFSNCIFTSTEYNKESITIQIDMRYFCYIDRFYKIDFSHATLVIKNLAKLHALSFVLAKLCPKNVEKIQNICNKDVQYGDVKSIPSSLKSYFMASVAVVSDLSAKEKLMEIEQNILILLNKTTSPIPNYSTICHGDCWSNNLIFKYHKNKPVDSLLVDFQLVRYASPVTDLSYFFYMSADRHFLHQHYDQLINIYYGTLSAVIRQCDLNIEEIYPKDIFYKHLREYSVYGLIEALISMKIITAEPEEAAKMVDMKYNHPNILCQYESKNRTLYIDRVNSVVDHFFQKNYSLYNVLNQ